jgi:hypothetical protein
MTTGAQGSAAPPPAKPAKKEPGGYIVLEQGTGGGWTERGTFQTASQSAAVRQFADAANADAAGAGMAARVLVAVPARSWRPVKVSAKTETKMVVEAAS